MLLFQGQWTDKFKLQYYHSIPQVNAHYITCSTYIIHVVTTWYNTTLLVPVYVIIIRLINPQGTGQGWNKLVELVSLNKTHAASSVIDLRLYRPLSVM